MHNSKIIQLFFGVALALYAFALVAFDNERFLGLVHIIAAVLSLSFLGYALVAKVRLRFPPPLIAYAVLVAFCAASIFWSVNQGYSIGKTRTMVQILFSAFILFNVIVHFCNATYFFVGMYAAILLNLLMVMGIVKMGLTMEDAQRFAGSINQANLMGYIGHVTVFFGFLHIMTIPARQIKAARKMLEIVVLLVVCTIAVFVTFLTGSRTAIGLLAALVLLMLFSSLFRPMVALPLLVIIVGGTVLSNSAGLGRLVVSGDVDVRTAFEHFYNRLESGADVGEVDGSREERAALGRKAYAMYQQNPLIGNGIGAFEYENKMYAHNGYLETMSSVGVVGLILLLSFYLLILRDILKLRQWKLKALFGVMWLSFILYDLALVAFTNKFQILTPVVTLACIYSFRLNGERSLEHSESAYDPYVKRRRRRRRPVLA